MSSGLFSDDAYDKFDPKGKEIGIKYFTGLGYKNIPKDEDRGIDLLFEHEEVGKIYVEVSIRHEWDFPLTKFKEAKPHWKGIVHILERRAKGHKWYPDRAFTFEINRDLKEAFLFNCNVLTDDKKWLVFNRRYKETGEMMYNVHYSRAQHCKIGI